MPAKHYEVFFVNVIIKCEVEVKLAEEKVKVGKLRVINAIAVGKMENRK